MEKSPNFRYTKKWSFVQIQSSSKNIHVYFFRGFSGLTDSRKRARQKELSFVKQKLCTTKFTIVCAALVKLHSIAENIFSGGLNYSKSAVKFLFALNRIYNGGSL